ncbi:MAG: hypothetical protein R2940_15655 [Syntrophotaleaceae bacterium]
MGQKQTKEPATSKDLLYALLDVEHDANIPWAAGDFKAILEHQLHTPLISESERFGEISRQPAERVAGRLSVLSCRTFQDILQHPSPSVEVLQWIKDFAKAAVKNDSDLPKEVGRVLYILAILRAQATHRACITTMPPLEIKNEAYRSLTFPWLPDGIQKLIRDSLRCLC